MEENYYTLHRKQSLEIAIFIFLTLIFLGKDAFNFFLYCKIVAYSQETYSTQSQHNWSLHNYAISFKTYLSLFEIKRYFHNMYILLYISQGFRDLEYLISYFVLYKIAKRT